MLIVGDTICQDTKMSESLLTATAEAMALRKDAACAVASMGFAMIPVKAPWWRLSKWNERPLNAAAVKKMLKNFKGDGVHLKRTSNVIPVIVHRDEIDLTSLVDASQIPGGLKSVVWLARRETVDIANGRHRMESLKRYMAAEEKQLGDAEKEVVRLQGTASSPAQIAALAKATEFRDQKKEYFDSLGEWVAQFYDIGERPPIPISIARSI